jgi:hypothetical protein
MRDVGDGDFAVETLEMLSSNRILVKGASLLFGIALCLGCDIAGRVVSVLTQVLQNLTAAKTLMETFVQDVKQQFPPTEPAYKQAELEYNEARAAYEGYLSAVKVATSTGDTQVDLSQLADKTQELSAEFLANSTKSLAPTRTFGRRTFDQVMVLPPNLHRDLCRLPKQHRLEALGKLDANARWRAWSEVN